MNSKMADVLNSNPEKTWRIEEPLLVSGQKAVTPIVLRSHVPFPFCTGCQWWSPRGASHSNVTERGVAVVNPDPENWEIRFGGIEKPLWSW